MRPGYVSAPTALSYDDWLLRETVLAHAADYAATLPHPSDVGEAQALADEALLAGCARVFGDRAALSEYRRVYDALHGDAQ